MKTIINIIITVCIIPISLRAQEPKSTAECIEQHNQVLQGKIEKNQHEFTAEDKRCRKENKDNKAYFACRKKANNELTRKNHALQAFDNKGRGDCYERFQPKRF